MIRLKNVNKYYQSGSEKIHVIRDLNYEFPNTGLIFILGPSGSGKSTLLNLLGGLDKADSGEIWIEDREMSSFSKKEHNYYLNSYLGFVFQEYNILKDLNLKENISLSLEIQGKNKKLTKTKVNEIIKEVELEGLEKRKVNQLSGGQKQRIAIARALVKDPKLIIADEPTGNLDSSTSKKIFELFKKMSKKRLIIIVTHDEESASLYGDDILRIDTANVEEKIDVKVQEKNEINIDNDYFERNLYLQKAKTPYKTIFKLAFKNMWIKKLRYLLIFIISTISLVFLSFAIELNGDKLYQNVYTTVNNNVTYTDIYQYHPTESTEKSNDFYAKYEMGELMNGAYNAIKQFAPDITMHKYQSVSINYSKYNIEKYNFLYKGTIDTVIYFDPTNTYNLLAGQLPNVEAPEILITDYLLDAFKHFGIVDINTNIYNIINKHIDLGYNVSFKVVGVIGTNYNKWHHLSRLPKSYVLDTYDKSMQGFSYDFLVMNSIIVGSKYYNYIQTDSFQNSKITINNFELQESALVSYENQAILLGNAPSTANEILIPFSLAERMLNFTYPWWANRNDAERLYYLESNILNSSSDRYLNVSTSCNKIETETGSFEVSANGSFKIVGVTSSRDFVLSRKGFDSYNEAVMTSKSSNDDEKIIIELPKNPAKALSQFNKLYNTDYRFIINVFNYKDTIESYNVDPMIEFASTGGLVVFALLAIGIMWTIISIEIVDSKKEIGIMRSIGLNGFKVSLIFIIQALFVNILSYLASLPLANEVIKWYGSTITNSLNEIELSMYTLTYRSPIILFVFIISITLISAFIPLIKIMSKKIINVINERDE